MKYNKGEWSEFFAFMKVLADRAITPADAALTLRPENQYPVVQVERLEDDDLKIFKLTAGLDVIEVTVNGESTLTADSSELRSELSFIFNELKAATGPSFEMPEIEAWMSRLGCTKIKAKSLDKKDITLVIHDPRTVRDSKVGFSIKSNIGSAPTLLNASAHTNFVYQVDCPRNCVPAINAITKKPYYRKRLAAIRDEGRLDFLAVDSAIFRRNIRKIDSLMPEILAEMLLAFYSGQASAVKELCRIAAGSSVITEMDLDEGDVQYKIKQLLVNSALGFTPSVPWSGYMNADGGYLVLKDNGEIGCYHIYNMRDFSDYLFENTKFETPASRNGFGEIYEKDSMLYIKFNLQIRFM